MMKTEVNGVSGVELEYYFVCPTMLWLYSHNLINANEDEIVKDGKVLHESGYKRDKKEVHLNRSVFDVVKLGNEYVVYERKRSKLLKAHELQLKFYLFQLHLKGIKAKGVLIAPGSRKVVVLTALDISTLENAVDEIKKIKTMEDPPKPKKIRRCQKCAYRMFCFGDEGE